jgi:hypothetical protein
MNQKVTDIEILSHLNVECGVVFVGGKSTLTLSKELHITESAIRKRLNKLESTDKIYAYCPRPSRTFLWFKGSAEPLYHPFTAYHEFEKCSILEED